MPVPSFATARAPNIRPNFAWLPLVAEEFSGEEAPCYYTGHPTCVVLSSELPLKSTILIGRRTKSGITASLLIYLFISVVPAAAASPSAIKHRIVLIVIILHTAFGSHHRL